MFKTGMAGGTGRVGRWTGVVVAAVLVLVPQPGWAQYMPRAPVQVPQAVVIEGWWGYPCVSVLPGCFPDADVDWVPLEVAAWVGGQKFIGAFTGFHADRESFEVTVQVPPSAQGDMVMLEVTAQAPQGHVARFTNIQGVAHQLQSEADAQGRVLRTDKRPNMLTIMSTALVGLLEDANGGDWRMDEATFQQHLPQVDPARLMRHAVAFEALVSGTLPGAGVVDPNALVGSADAVDAYLDEVPEPVLQGVFDRFQTWGWSAYQPIDFDALDLTLVPAASPGTIAFGRREGVRMRSRDSWEEEGGFSTLIDTGLVRGLTTYFLIHTDSLQRAARVVRPRQPSFESQRITYDCPGEGEVQALRITARSPFMFRRMAMAGGVEFVEFTESRELDYLPIGGGPVPCVADLPAFETGRIYALAYPPRGRARGFVALRRGLVALQMLNPGPDPMAEDSQFIAGVVNLATGAVDAPGYAASGELRRGPGALLTLEVDTVPGSALDGRVEMRLEGLRGDGLGAEEWAVSSRVVASSDDHMRAHVTPVVALDAGFAVTTAMLEGQWRSGHDVSVPRSVDALSISFDPLSGQGMKLAPGGASVPFSWWIQEGQVQASTFALDSQPGALLPACPPGASDCREVLRRVWVPLRLDMRDELRRLYVIEELHADEGAGLQRLSRQLNFYDAP